jgi:carboxypeptidase family protein
VRKLLALALVLASTSLGAPVVGFAQSLRPPVGSVSGQLVDVGGRALANQRVELLSGGASISSTITGNHGEWSFANVAPGDYVVRASVNGTLIGARVSVASGQVATALIVAPSAAAPSAAFLGGLGVLGGSLVIAGVVAAVITTVVLVTGS